MDGVVHGIRIAGSLLLFEPDGTSGSDSCRAPRREKGSQKRHPDDPEWRGEELFGRIV